MYKRQVLLIVVTFVPAVWATVPLAVPPTGTFTNWVVVHEVLIPPNAVMAAGDTLTITWVVTITRQRTGTPIMIDAVGTYVGGLGELVGRLYTELQSTQLHGSAQFGINAIALSDSAAALDPTVTVLPQIKAGLGLGIANGTVAHTAGTNVTTITNTFTYVTAGAATHVSKSALYTSTTAGTTSMYFYGNFSSNRQLTNGDSITVTWTMTVSGT